MAIDENVAADILAKCGRCCCVCRRFMPVRLKVYQIVPSSEGDSDDPDNLIALCISCHSDVHTHAQFTLRFSPQKLKQYREEVFRLVRGGNLPVSEADDRGFADLIRRIQNVGRNALAALPVEAIELLIGAARGDGTIIVGCQLEMNRRCWLQAGEFTFDEYDKHRESAAYRHGLRFLQQNGLAKSPRAPYVAAARSRIGTKEMPNANGVQVLKADQRQRDSVDCDAASRIEKYLADRKAESDVEIGGEHLTSGQKSRECVLHSNGRGTAAAVANEVIILIPSKH